MSVTIRGTLLPLLQHEEWDFDPSRGYLYRATFRGASQELMLAQQQDLARGGIACRLLYNQGDSATLEVEDSTQQYTLDVWQLVGNEESRDIFSHPTILGLTTGDQVAIVRQHLEWKDPPDAAFADDGISGLAGGPVQKFYSLNLRGTTDYRRQQYVLRHTTNAPNRWNSNISDFGIDRIYTPAQLLSEVQNSGLWVVPIPGRLAYKIANIPFPTFQPDYLWGWLKGASTETTAANNRVEINTEYVLEQWSTALYQPF